MIMVRICMLFAIFASLCGSVVSQPLSETSRSAAEAVFSDSILTHLRGDIQSQIENPQGVASSLLEYLAAQMLDPWFPEVYGCELSRYRPTGIGAKLAAHWDSYSQFDLQGLSIYVFLPTNAFREATVASFRDETELGFVTLHDELKSYYLQEYNRRDSLAAAGVFPEEENSIIRGDSLIHLFPNLCAQTFCLVSESEVRETKISGLVFSFPMIAGAFQIRVEFVDTLTGVIFACPKGEILTIPRLAGSLTATVPQPLSGIEGLTSIGVPGGLCFVSTTCPVPTNLTLLWDSRVQSIKHMSIEFDYFLRDEYPCYDRKYLLEYGTGNLVLRVAEECADLILLHMCDYEIRTIADETAPEL